MNTSTVQPSLFDSHERADNGQAESARIRMRGMIDALKAKTLPPWQDQVGIILDDGAFQRAMRLVPAEEAQTLWVEFDVEMERLYTLWLEANPPPSD